MYHKETNNNVAVKIIEKKGITDNTIHKSIKNEIEIQRRIIHENIIRLITYVEDDHKVHIVMEYANKGTLFTLLRRKQLFSEKEAFYYFTQVCSAIQFLHINQLIHRDIKPENLLLNIGRAHV